MTLITKSSRKTIYSVVTSIAILLCAWTSLHAQQVPIPPSVETEQFNPNNSRGSTVEIQTRFFPNQAPVTRTAELVDGYVVIEGDIVLASPEDDVDKAAILNISNAEWPNSTIPYEIEAGYPDLDMIYFAINHVINNTNICMVPRTNETNYVKFINAGGCYSNVGMIGGEQDIGVNPGCGIGATIHEILHAAGHWHEQSREDRDNYVDVHLENVTSDREHNFDKYSIGLDHGPYDYGSLMHYGPTAFSTNGSNTIDIKRPPGSATTIIGQRLGVSAGDIAAVNAVYTSAPSCNIITGLPQNISIVNYGTLSFNGLVVTISGAVAQNTGGVSLPSMTGYVIRSVPGVSNNIAPSSMNSVFG